MTASEGNRKRLRKDIGTYGVSRLASVDVRFLTPLLVLLLILVTTRAGEWCSTISIHDDLRGVVQELRMVACSLARLGDIISANQL